MLNVAHVGRLVTLKVNVPPSESLPVGVNEYCVPAVAVVGGVPEIDGGTFGTALTTIENVASCAVPPCASLTPMTIPENVPTFAAVGVPDNRPVAVLNVAQAGRFVMLKVNAPPRDRWPSAERIRGARGDSVGGAPVIVGGWFGAALTTSRTPRASVALTVADADTMFANVPTLAAAGVPCSRPVVVLNVAQLGWLVMLNVSVPPSGRLRSA